MKTASDMPERVYFLNSHNGSVFFDCHPSEARIAIRAVKETRESGEHADVLKRLEVQVNAIVNAEAVERELPAVLKVTGHHYADVFADLENTGDEKVERAYVTHILMNAKTYVELRKWDRDILTVRMEAALNRAGFVAELWGAKIVVTRRVSPGVLLFVVESVNKDGTKAGAVYRYKINILPEPPYEPTEQEKRLTRIEQAIERIETELAKE